MNTGIQVIEYKETNSDFMLQFARQYINVITRQYISIQQGTFEIKTGIIIEPAFMTMFLVSSNVSTLSMNLLYEPKKELILSGWCAADCNIYQGEIIAKVFPATLAFDKLAFRKLLYEKEQ